MTALLANARNSWFISFTGILLLSLFLWLIGPLISVAGIALLESPVLRAVLIAALLAVWAACFVAVRWHARSSGERLARAIPEAVAPKNPEELGLLSQRLRDAIDRLKKTGRGKAGLYEIPWYIIIGPPGSGKTTALKNSGLRFPPGTADAVAGVGGTRNCDWWFSEQAVILDTAGRYTTQDSDAHGDSAEWLGFLDLLKKHRRRQPVNGVLVAISLADLAMGSEAERQAHAVAIRRRIGELNDRLGLRLPVYLLFTKADLVAGFVEFFSDMGKEARAQVWGASFPFDDGNGPEAALGFAAAFDGLADRVGERVIDRIHGEADIGRRGAILGFPLQFAALKQPLSEFIDLVFRASRYEKRPLLRGVYFTSGTQLGNPIDRLMAAMAGSFGLRPEARPAFAGQGRSYFLTRLLTEVIFPEAGLVGTDRAVERRQRLTRLGAGIAAGLTVAATAAALTVSYFGNVALVDQVAAAAAQYRAAAEGADSGRLDWPAVVQLLDQARDLPTGFGHRADPVPLALTFGLYQGDKLSAQTVGAYRRALSFLLLPKLARRLEGQLRGHLDQPDFLFEGLETYLVLTKRVVLHDQAVKRWFSLDFAAQFPAPEDEGLRRSLEGHVGALVAGEFTAPTADDRLVDQVRAVLRQVPPAQRVLSLIAQGSAASRLPDWVLLEKAGPGAAQVLTRRSGKPLADGIPGLYTRDGFHRVLLPQLPVVAAEVLKEAALIDRQGDATALQVERIRTLSRQALALYYDEYARRWESLLDDVAVVPFRSLDQAVQVLNVLGGLGSPLRQMILSVSAETLLTQPPADVKAANQAKDLAVEEIGRSVREQRLAALMGPLIAGNADIPGKPVEDRFRRLRQMTEGTPSQLDAIVDSLARLYRQTSETAGAGNPGAALLATAGGPANGNVAQALAMEAARMPPPFSTILGGVARSSTALAAGGAHGQLNGLWQSDVLPFCRQVTEGRYPFVKDSALDVPLDDFARLLGPGGLVLQFFNSHVARFVDTSRRPWRWQRVDHADLGLSRDSLEQFERAMAIGDAFFRGGNQPAVAFDVTARFLDADATEVALTLGDQRLSYSHGPQVPVHLHWPALGGIPQAALSFQPLIPGSESGIVKDGAWSLFRLLDNAAITRGPAPERFTAAFSAGGKRAAFDIRASSLQNPFDLRDLRRFRCPSSL